MAEMSRPVSEDAAEEEPPALAVESEDSAAERPRSRPSTSPHWVFFTLSALVVVLGLLLSVPGEERVYLPFLNKVSLPGLCFAREYAGIPCPGCGLTRCFISISHGELGRAWHFNPAGFLLFGMLLFQFPYRLVQIWRVRNGRDELHLRQFSWALYVTVAVMLSQWVFKLLTGSY